MTRNEKFFFDPSAFVKICPGYELAAAFALKRAISPNQTNQKASNFSQVQTKTRVRNELFWFVFTPLVLQHQNRTSICRDVCH